MAKQAKIRPPRPNFAPVPVAARRNGWTPEKQGAFIDALAECGCVQEACAHVGMSRNSAYQLRMRPEAQGFRLAWDAALDFAIRRLSDEVLSRALNGEPVPHYYQGELVGEHRRYDNRLAMFLLRYRDPLRYAASLDQMVYSGHPETAAIAFVKARNRMLDEAHGIADAPPAEADPTGMPFTRKPTFQVAEEQATQALIESDAEIGGSHARREWFQQARADHYNRKQAEEKARREAQKQEREAAAARRRAEIAALEEVRNPEEAESLRQALIAERAKEGDPEALASFLSSLNAPPGRPVPAFLAAPPPEAPAPVPPRPRPPPAIR